MRLAAAVSIAAVMLLAGLCDAKPYCKITADSVVLGNSALQREWVRQGEAWVSARLVRGDGKEAVALEPTDEFVVKLYEGATISSNALHWPAPTVADREGRKALVWRIGDPASGLSLVVSYWIWGDRPLMWKTVTVSGEPGDVVDEIEVDRLATAVPITRGGYGQPAFLGNAWFTGLQYPAGYNDLGQADGQQTVVLHHYPGREAGAGLTSKTAVLGVAPAGLTRELAFSDYLGSIRIQTRDFLQYNSWYDLRRADLTQPKIMASFRQFKTNLLDPYGLKMDAFVPDDGWQDPNSIWQPDKALLPEGFRPLAEELEKNGSRLGIWMPLNGTNLNIEWGRQQGYEVSDRGKFYCIVGPKYNAEIRRVTAERIRDGHLAYYKHDFNSMQCSAPGHGHLPTQRHGHEASLDAEIALLNWEREVDPDLFLNVTSNVWLSPWWLLHADSIWMCASDFGYDKTFPQLSPREWDMSYRDAHFYNVYQKQGNLVPLSALMTHGIIHGRLCQLGGKDETLREFSDMTVLYYARGVQLKELYISPEVMDAPRWQVLGEATRWAVDNAETLRNTVMIGGDLRRGEPYGYVHWNGDHGLIALRNPAPGAVAISVPFDQSVYYRGKSGRPFAARVIYPYDDNATVPWVSGKPRTWQVPGCSVMVVEVRPGAAKAPMAASVTPLATEISSSGAGKPAFTLSFTLPQETMSRCDLYLILRGAGQTELRSLTINGAAAEARAASGPSWRLYAYDLASLAGQRVSVSGSLPAAGDLPFSVTQCPVEAWLVADRPTGAPAAVALKEHAPFPIAQGYRRDSLRLMQMTLDTGSGTVAHVTDEDITNLKAARLRLEVFDSNGEPQYADKWITLNGERLARVPANTGELSTWQEVFVDLPAEQVRKLQRSNTIKLGNAGGDCYKFRGVGLALQKADGKWVTTPIEARVFSSVDNWLHSDGEAFSGGSSPDIKVNIP